MKGPHPSVGDLRGHYALLGIEPDVGDEEVSAARRRAAWTVHPDRGGSTEAMTAVNNAFVAIMQARRATVPPPSRAVVAHDVPSFTIDVLPVDAFEYLVLAAQSLGEVVDSDPPYLLEVILRPSDGDVWCRLEVVPDAGSSTVSLWCDTTASFDAESCRDLWVLAINDLVT